MPDDIGADVRTYLQTKSAVTDLIGTRMYPDVLPENVTLPACTYWTFSSEPLTEVQADKTGVAMSRVQIDCYATTRAGAVALADAIRLAPMQGHRGTVGSSFVQHVIAEDVMSFGRDQPTDGSAEWRYIASQDYVVIHSSTDPS